MAVHDEILEWAKGRSNWQQDALRRLAEVATLSETDLEALTALCKLDGGIPPPDGTLLEAKPLAAPSLHPNAGNDAGPVTLRRIEKLVNVNALAEDQVIPFEPTGLTVIFGDNGTGKSGFGRLLRTLCWARRRPHAIHKNSFSDDQRPQQADVYFGLNGEEQPVFQWSAGAEPPHELRRVSVFDADCASVYINDERESTYAPFGLDLFPRLARVCDLVRARLTVELRQAEAGKAIWPEALVDTKVADLLGRLPEEAAADSLAAIAPLTDAEHAHLKEIEETLAQLKRDDPATRAKGLRAQVARLRAIRSRLVEIESALSDDAADQLKSSLTDVKHKRAASALASAQFRRDAFLPGTGADAWKELWEAARRYSTGAAYPDQAFPVVGDDARCVLCQQGLSLEASNRLAAFEAFVTDTVAQGQKAAEVLLHERLLGIRNANPNWADGAATESDLELVQTGLGDRLSEALTAATARREFLLSVTADTDWDVLPPLRPSLAPELAALATTLEERATTLETSVGDGAKREAFEREARETSAVAWTHANKAAIEAERARLQLELALRKLVGSPTDTAEITKAGNRFTERHVTQDLRDRLTEELKALRVAHLHVTLERKRGEKGVTVHQLTLDRGRERRVHEILSSGEQNTVALAAFFAELNPVTRDALVFDDPVSSLDQDKRDYVALRLVEEGERRQVIVWTHDLQFVGALEDWRERRKKPAMRILTLNALGSATGIVDSELPWPLLSVKDRLKRLDRELDAMNEAADAHDVERYQSRARLFYGHLRDTWERSVEEVLFKNVVRRWRKSVQTTLLREVADNVTRTDFEAVNEGMTRCSNFAHDPTTATPPPTPRIEEARDDLKLFRDWVATKQAKKTP